MDRRGTFALDECEMFFDKMDEDLDLTFALALQDEYNKKTEPEKCETFYNKIDEDLDYAFALSLQDEYNEKSESKKINQKLPGSNLSKHEPLGIVDQQWELIDPNPDIHALFLQYNDRFFYGKLDNVEVKWSHRMTLCAGVCSYEGRGGLCSVRLSLPLLKLRPRRDLVETLLHEMIHAYLFVTAKNKDRDAHGPEFLKNMNRINDETGTRISVYHSFHNEVDLYRKHWWKCNGPCQKRKPFYGLVKRATNRAPGSGDFWWSQHQSSCGGTFEKIKEPEDYKNKTLKRKLLKDDNQPSNIKKFLKGPSKQGSSQKTAKEEIRSSNSDIKTILSKDDNLVQLGGSTSKEPPNVMNVTAFSGQGFQLGSSSSTNVAPRSFLAKIRQELKSSDFKTSQPRPSKPLFNLPINESNKWQKNKQDKHSVAALSGSGSHQQHTTQASKPSSLFQSSMNSYLNSPLKVTKDKSSQSEKINSSPNKNLVECPVCFKTLSNIEINYHLDMCLLK